MTEQRTANVQVSRTVEVVQARQPHFTLAGLHADVSENRLPLENETSARLKITFVDMTYPGQRPQYPSLSPHFPLV